MRSELAAPKVLEQLLPQALALADDDRVGIGLGLLGQGRRMDAPQDDGDLATAIRRPALFRHLDRVLLALLGAATEQDDHAVAILAEIDSVAWAEVDLPLEHA